MVKNVSLSLSPGHTTHIRINQCCRIIELYSNNKTSCLVLKLPSFNDIKSYADQKLRAVFSGLCPSVRARCPCMAWPLSLSLSGTNGQLVYANKVKDLPVPRLRTATAASRGAESGGWRLLRVGDVLECFQVRAGETDHHRITDHIYCHVGIPEPHASCRKKAEKLHPLLRMRSTRLQLRVQFLSLSPSRVVLNNIHASGFKHPLGIHINTNINHIIGF